MSGLYRKAIGSTTGLRPKVPVDFRLKRPKVPVKSAPKCPWISQADLADTTANRWETGGGLLRSEAPR